LSAKYTVQAIKNLIKFAKRYSLGNHDILSILDQNIKTVKSPRRFKKINIPTEREVQKCFKTIRKKKDKVDEIIFKVFLESGIRITHFIEFLKNIDSLNVIQGKNVVVVDFDYFLGQKKINCVPMLIKTFNDLYIVKDLILKKYTGSKLSDHFYRCKGYLSLHRMRSFFSQKISELGFNRDQKRYILGHLNDITSEHYEDQKKLVLIEYEKYAVYFNKIENP